MLHFFYNLAIRLYVVGIGLAAFFNEKASLWRRGRANWPSQLTAALLPVKSRQAPVIWVHCASLGEFEQGRPLIEAIKQKYPHYALVLSFFSPSGYEIRKNYAFADVVTYLPADTPGQARQFVSIVQPVLAIFVKYEFWYNHLLQLKKAGVPILLLAARFRPEQSFFHWYGSFFKKALHFFHHLFVQNQQSIDLLRQIGIHHCSISGDTRIDRVLQMAAQQQAFPLIDAFVARAPVFVAGSTWPADEQLLGSFFKKMLPPDWKVIIAPHQIDAAHLSGLESQLPGAAIRYSQAQGLDLQAFRFLIIDNVGMLSQLYRYGRLAYIGGGFGAGIHNTLEPAAYGLPVIFGPRFQKFDEARDLVEAEGFFSVKNETELNSVFQTLYESGAYKCASEKVIQYLNTRQGATQLVMSYLAQVL